MVSISIRYAFPPRGVECGGGFLGVKQVLVPRLVSRPRVRVSFGRNDRRGERGTG